MLPERRANLGQLNEHDVAQLALREVRNADEYHIGLACGLQIFVVIGIQQILRDI